MRTASQSRRRLNLWIMALVIPVAVWAAIGLEGRALYHPDMTSYPSNPLAGVHDLEFKARIQDAYFTASDGIRLNGWFIPARDNKPTVVFAHGNGGNLGDRWTVMRMFTDRGYGFLAFDYRGYGNSQGIPEEQGLYRDMEAASRFLADEKQIPVQNQIALGGSLGSGVVVDVATRWPYKAVVIYAAYTSTPAVAAHLRNQHVPWLGFIPLQKLMRQQFNSLEKIEKVKSPLIIMHGDKDAMMPLTMPEALYRKASVPNKKLLIIKGSGHNEVFHEGAEQLFTSLARL